MDRNPYEPPQEETEAKLEKKSLDPFLYIIAVVGAVVGAMLLIAILVAAFMISD